jgi:hypothetical protein
MLFDAKFIPKWRADKYPIFTFTSAYIDFTALGLNIGTGQSCLAAYSIKCYVSR